MTMLPRPPETDGLRWPEFWREYVSFDGRAVVRHNYKGLGHYVIEGTVEVPGMRTVYAGQDEDEAKRVFQERVEALV